MFFDINPLGMPRNAQYYFDVCVINIAVRRSLTHMFEDIWDLSAILSPRPHVIHIFADNDEMFDRDIKYEVNIEHHCVVEVNGTEVDFFTTDSSNYDDEDGWYDLIDMDDFWRF